MPPSHPPRPAAAPLSPTPQLACTSSRTPAGCALVSCLLPCGTCTSMALACTVCMAMGLSTGHWTQQQCWNSMLGHWTQQQPWMGHWAQHPPWPGAPQSQKAPSILAACPWVPKAQSPLHTMTCTHCIPQQSVRNVCSGHCTLEAGFCTVPHHITDLLSAALSMASSTDVLWDFHFCATLWNRSWAEPLVSKGIISFMNLW